MNKNFKIYVKKPNGALEEYKNSKPEVKKFTRRNVIEKDFWQPENLLGEIIEPDNIDVDALLKKDTLCPKIWDENEQMHPEVRDILLKNALEFIKFAGLENAKFKDIILTGSLANYNWHEGSDLDVHILLDYNTISDDTEFVGDFFRTKKALWGEKMPVKVMGHDVEIYVQDINEPHASTGVYSIWNDKWLTKPIKEMIAVDTNNIQKKATSLMDTIDDLFDTVDDNEVARASDALMEKLKNYRKAGLEDEGEFSTENLVFKILRNTGYLEKLSQMKHQSLQRELTLEQVLGEAGGSDKLKRLLQNTTVAFGMAVAGLALNSLNSDSLFQLGVQPQIVNKAEKYLNSIGQQEMENVIQKAQAFPAYLEQKIKELDNEEILN